MENKINIAQLLKDCPKGMELDCTMLDDVVFEKISFGVPNHPIVLKRLKTNTTIYLTKYGQYSDAEDYKCVIFPKGKTTWEGFVPPCEFKDGDIIFTHADSLKIGLDNTWISIFKENSANGVITYAGIKEDGSGYYDNTDEEKGLLCSYNDIVSQRFATEEEKQKLFDAIKANGYKWDEEAKTLEKLVELIEDKGNISDGYHTFNELYEYRLLYNASMFNELAKQGLYDVHKSKKHSDGTIPFGDENWFIVQAELPTGQISNHYEMKDWDLFNVPEKEKANPYDGHTPQDVAKRLRDFLSLEKLIKPKFKVGDKVKRKDVNYTYIITIAKFGGDYYDYVNEDGQCGVIHISKQDDWELVPNKFDITTLKPFDKVLVRDSDKKYWSINFFGFYNKITEQFHCSGNTEIGWDECIPYENNQHLLSTTDICDDFYKTWE